ncbi:MAG TPA: response regulator, partial [Pyrinomonadaceae bacterium]|nr:response regulator [Pyrinomonadaceae bacterium]
LAGRKLLLADDSATIQKVIDLTFADEGVRVLAVSSGQEALDQILDFAPDIVLADVFMPSPDGYEVCKYVKTHEQLKHIPVMLLVGSFEPFDEAEARRVGADDILTKPFSSIRRLIDRVGSLVSSPPVEKEARTAELPKTEEEAEEPRLSTQELEVTTADTMPLPDDMVIDTLPRVEQPVSSASESSVNVTPSARLEALLQSSPSKGTSEHEGRMEPGITETKSEDVLLDLGDIEPAQASADADEFVLDLDDASGDEAPAYAAASSGAPMRAFVEPQVTEAPAPAYESTYQPESSYQPEVHSSFAETQEVPYAVTEIEPYEAPAVPPELTPDPVPVFGQTEFPIADTPQSQPATSTSISADQLSPEMIDAIARRAVELMSDKVIREIAWEVVPDLAELLIKRQLEEKQAK